MDEAPEFQRQVIDALRQPLESRTITINRSQGNYMYPANFYLYIGCKSLSLWLLS